MAIGYLLTNERIPMMNSAEEVVAEIESWARSQCDALKACLFDDDNSATAVVVEARYWAMNDLLAKIEELTKPSEEQAP